MQKVSAFVNRDGEISGLKAMLMDAVGMHQSGILSLDSIRAHIRRARPSDKSTGPIQRSNSPGQVIFPEPLPGLKEIQKLLVAEAMDRAEANQTIAAGMLGISRQSLYKRLKQIS